MFTNSHAKGAGFLDDMDRVLGAYTSICCDISGDLQFSNVQKPSSLRGFWKC